MFLSALAAAVALAVIPPESSRQNDDKGTWQELKDPSGRFTLQYPKKDWRVLPGGGSVLVTLAHKDNRAVVTVEYSPLDVPLLPDELTDLFPRLEADELRRRQPAAGEFTQELVERPGGRYSRVSFARKGFLGSERVVQATMPLGLHLYRISCTATDREYVKFAPVFATIVETFRGLPQ
jgi:hypothetical protein